MSAEHITILTLGICAIALAGGFMHAISRIEHLERCIAVAFWKGKLEGIEDAKRIAGL